LTLFTSWFWLWVSCLINRAEDKWTLSPIFTKVTHSLRAGCGSSYWEFSEHPRLIRIQNKPGASEWWQGQVKRGSFGLLPAGGPAVHAQACQGFFRFLHQLDARLHLCGSVLKGVFVFIMSFSWDGEGSAFCFPPYSVPFARWLQVSISVFKRTAHPTVHLVRAAFWLSFVLCLWGMCGWCLSICWAVQD
jgi:hypothetical protein